MYSDTVQSFLDEHDVEIGDHVRIETEEDVFEGVVMPRSRSGNQDCVVLKLENGYNVGVEITDDTSIEQTEEAGVTIDTGEESHEHSTVEVDPDKPTVAILHTGGTIASKVSYEEGGVTPVTHAEDLVEMYPELTDIANIKSVTVRQMFSEDMEFQHYELLRDKVNAVENEVDGVIIGHGTDTMHYTAAALSFLTNPDLPVVLVGAQRSSDRPSSDAAMNLISAARFATETNRPGVYLCMHHDLGDDMCAIHPGTRTRKTHTSRRDTFKTFDTAPVATVSYPDGNITVHQNSMEQMQHNNQEELQGGSMAKDVALVMLHPGFDPGVVDYYHEQGCNGIVLAGTGLGHAPVNSIDEYTEHHEELLENLSYFVDDGGIVVMTSQCSRGATNMDVYDTGRKLKEAGVIPGKNLLPETAYVKLGWALGTADTREEAVDLFKTNVAGEYVDRREPGGAEG